MNNQNISFEETLFISSHPNIITKKNPNNILKSILLLLASCGAICSSFLLQENNITLCMVFLIGGSALASYAIYLMTGKNSRKIYSPTGSEVKEKTIFFDRDKKQHLLSCVEKGTFKEVKLEQSNMSGSIRLDIMLSTDKKFAAAQLMEFEPFSFYPASPIYYYKEEQAEELYGVIK